VKLEQFKLARREFGYYRVPRNGVQSVIGPAYFYMYEPLEGVDSKKPVEIISAVSDPDVAALLEDDAAMERNRLESRQEAAADERQ
jgi:hypothetical protein